MDICVLFSIKIFNMFIKSVFFPQSTVVMYLMLRDIPD